MINRSAVGYSHERRLMKIRLCCLMTLCLCLILLGTGAASPQKLLAESRPVSEAMNAVFDTPYRHTLQSDYASIRRSTLSEWTDTVWQNDVLDAKITVGDGSQPLEQVAIRSSDFINGKHRISAENADIRWLQETLANIGNAQPEAPVAAYPDIIHQSGTARIEAGQLKSAWVSLTIPKDAVCGIYTGTLEGTATGHSPVTLTLTFEVLDLTAPGRAVAASLHDCPLLCGNSV